MVRLGEKDFDNMYSLLKISFIADELRPYNQQKALLKKSIYHVFAEREADTNQLRAFIALWDLKDFVFVDYFAVHPIYRNQGIGQKILQEVFDMTQKNICLEIETPVNEITNRRLRFYQRNHFKLCNYDYKQPPVAKGNAPVSLSLMSSRDIQHEKDFKNICKEVYKFMYKPFI